METTATFVPHAGEDGEGEWDLHSPTISSTKWWIGGAGETSTHAAVYARLLCGGVDHGVHTFVVQLRDPDTGSLMPGVHVGDVGAKYGRNGIDNGWIRFHHVRLPARAQLRRWAKVAPDGTYTRAVSAKNNAMAYGALLMGRASMIGDCAAYLSMATTVAVRWAVGRRQGARQQADGLPPQLMDFKTHQAKLMPLVAYAYALTVTSHRMKAMYDNVRCPCACAPLHDAAHLPARARAHTRSVWRPAMRFVCAAHEWLGLG
ncbi:hypothetical protein EON67_09085 [archaeon]|nr:MAG: hypothetical protein EON67_09085 [archaeon]